MSYIGLDIGTTGCKAVAFDENGRQLSAAYREYPVLSPREDWAELDSALVCDSCLDVIRQTALACEHDTVRAIGISSQGEAFTPVGRDGHFLGNAMVSSDVRSAAIADSWSAEYGRKKLYEITGHTAHPMFTLFKLLWARDNQPDVWSRAAAFYCFEDLMQWRLGVEPAMSWPLAGRTMMFDVRRHDWDDDILLAVGLKRSQLARTLASGRSVGTIPSDMCRELSLGDGAVVVTGGHDQPCGALGAGVVSPGVAVYGMGTTECITPAFAAPVFSERLFESNLCTYDFTIPGMYTTVAFSLTGGNLLRWFRDEFGRAEVDEAARTGRDPYTLILDDMASEPTNLMVLPYFTPSGTPYFDSEVKSAILGLRLSTSRGEFLRALLEGVAFEMRLNLDILGKSGIAVSQLLATGGGARDARLIQLKADVLHTPIRTVEVTEAGCLGVAMLACSATTGESLQSLAERWVRVTGVVEPSPYAKYYDSRFAEYVRLYPAIRAIGR